MSTSASPNDLVGIERLAIVCDDCGRRRVWGRSEIARAQLRWGVRSAIQLGSRLSCKHCGSRGNGGHNVSIYVDGVAQQHAEAGRSLSEAEAVTAVCSDCGHQVRLGREALADMPDVKTFEDLWNHAICAPCRAAGAQEANVLLSAEWGGAAEPSPAQQAPAWSAKPVFTENREDPFPALPRSRLCAAPNPEHCHNE